MVPDQCAIHQRIMEMLIWKMSWIPADTRWLPNESLGQQSYFNWLVNGDRVIEDPAQESEHHE